ncbi:S24/S26 family peptidase [Methylorubrum suomiense]
METRGERLKWARETYQRLRGERLSARAFAVEHDVAVPTYATHERDGGEGGKRFPEDLAERYARILGVDFQWLHRGRAGPPRNDTVTIVGLVGLGDQIQWAEEGDLSLGEVELPYVVDRECFGLEARGSSQYPRVKDGEVVVARWLSDRPSNYVGLEVVLKTMDGTYLLKTLKRHEGDDHFTIGSHNAPDVENVHIERVAEVVSIVPNRQWKRIG